MRWPIDPLEVAGIYAVFRVVEVSVLTSGTQNALVIALSVNLFIAGIVAWLLFSRLPKMLIPGN